MNKQEVIEKLEYLKRLLEEGSKDSYNYGFINALKYTLNVVKQLKEQEKPKVPQFVADMIVKRKRAGQSVVKAIENLRFYEDACKWVRNNGETFVKAWLYGYEVEKEKLYEVFLKRTGAQLGVCVPHDEYKTQFTKTELQEYDFNVLYAYDVKEVEE